MTDSCITKKREKNQQNTLAEWKENDLRDENIQANEVASWSIIRLKNMERHKE